MLPFVLGRPSQLMAQSRVTPSAAGSRSLDIARAPCASWSSSAKRRPADSTRGRCAHFHAGRQSLAGGARKLDRDDIHDRVSLSNHLGALAQHRESHHISCWCLQDQETLDAGAVGR
jgi:hypothetical protein